MSQFLRVFLPTFVRMLILIISRSSSKLGQVASKPSSLGQITEKLRVHSSGHSLDPKFMKLCQNVNPHKIKDQIETGACWIKN